jgi:putative spermidine/putrescine transport system permease protein
MRALFQRDSRLGIAVAVPFAAFIVLFLVYPITVVAWKAMTPGGQLGFDALARAMSGTYRQGFINSSELSFTSAVLGGLIGLVLALVVSTLRRPRWLHPTLESWSAVASQLGGVPLAFAFIATIGTQGLVTKALSGFGLDLRDYGVTVTGFWGIVVVYLYFQIPLMFLVMTPAIAGLRRSWREAAAIMGASPTRYWLSVGGPILAPSVLGGMILLFINSFIAYATVFVLNQGGALVPLQIRFLLQGNVITGQEDLGNAIVLWVITLLLASLFVMTALQRRALRWMRS